LKEGFADGGDMLLTPAGMMIGLSKRTNPDGAAELTGLLQQLGIRARTVSTPADTLHLKSDCSLLDEDLVLCTAGLAASGLFNDYRTLVVPDNEKRAANSLRVRDTILVGEEFPRTIDLLQRDGFNVKAVPIAGIGRLDAGLSCMSLRWQGT
jgi:dimethylargininase